ncbi:bifunctional helix-turn-helix transcriptional regulator/GNAT family N-acetyltransferase [Mesorhizobium sp. L-8-3]|uniref:bifunctional helix-turn-helix transcriptional regulator/GNAT family N-acetyltransferase n=1 Tax=Mesorhizobium sp. L-8-3 TaxID=2744522 RepID=UPI001927A93B|nr:helix-turn-helix domain-containing GNAT family N-acetyltransferase [Mesorhizobium sp. L-8-3]BCH25930.1 MarR family transcriptional regulator [Mesorhizobium sp. L-8-3]
MSDQSALIAEIRRFNRFYTRTVGLLDETLTQSAFTLTEARVLFELGHRDGPSASEIAADLRLDPAYLTRILRKFAASGLTEARVDTADGRRRILSLTGKGREALAKIQSAADLEASRLVGGLSASQRAELEKAMRRVTRLLGPTGERPQISLRPHRVGDIGWVVERQALLYAEEYGWDISFEALLAEIGAAFIRDFREGKDFCWIAECDGEPVGAVFLVHDGDETAKLRMLHVEAAARGMGIGKLLVGACIEKARAFGYRRMVLWTNDVLSAARAIYQRAGFRLVAEERHHSFGKDLVGQTWELEDLQNWICDVPTTDVLESPGVKFRES